MPEAASDRPSSSDPGDVDGAGADPDIGSGAGWIQQAVREHSGSLHGYCTALGFDDAAAGDIVHHAFVVAAELFPGLSDPGRTRIWLFALVRWVARRRVPEPGGSTGDTVELPAAGDERWTLGAFAAAAGGLRGPDLERVELSVRHGLAVPDIAAVTGAPARVVASRLARSVTLITRTGPPGLLDRYARLAPPEIGSGAWTRLQATLDSTTPALLTELADQVGKLDRHGFPRQRDRRRTRVVGWCVAGAVFAAAVLVVAVVVVPGQPTPRLKPVVAAPPPLPQQDRQVARLATPKASVRPTPSARRSSPTPSPTSQAPAALDATVSSARCMGDWQRFTVVATVTGATPTELRLSFTDSSGTYSGPMTVGADQRWTVSGWGNLPLRWWVDATLPAGATLRRTGATLDACQDPVP